MKYILSCVALLLLAAIGDAHAQSFPNRPIRLYTTFTAGGQADILARLVTDRVSAGLGQPVIVEPKPGAGGNIAMEAVAKATPDGYSMVFGTPAVAINGTLYRGMSFDPVKDLTPLSLAAWGPYAVYVSTKIPVNSVGDLIAYAKANPGKLNYASVGVGSGTHLAAVLFTLAAGIDMVHIPYKGIQQAAPDLASGQVHLTFNALGPLDSFLEAGTLKLLANSGPSPTPLPAYAKVPTISQTLPGFEALGWYGFFTAAGAPREAVARLNAEIVKAVREPEIWDRIVKLGLVPAPQSLAEARQFVDKEAEKWGRAVKASGAVAE
jgi:tripartite-type tricarboxylate transporter receptor subunit TctC